MLSWKTITSPPSQPPTVKILIIAVIYSCNFIFSSSSRCALSPSHALFLGTHLSVVAHCLPAVDEDFFVPSATIHCSTVSHRQSAKEKRVQSERPLPAQYSQPAGDNETALQRQDLTHNALIWHFSMLICPNHWDCAISVSSLKSAA